jgi:hypothetical protein
MSLDDLIALMERFVSGDAISLGDAGRLESALLEQAESEPGLEDLADDFAQYAPGRGELLLDFSQMRPRVAHHLHTLKARRALHS